jgi:hypothetical protein
MLRLVQTGNSLPFSFPVDPSAEFMPGQIAQLMVMGNNVVCGVSDGTAPVGIIDDIKTKAFSSVSRDEVIIAGPVTGVIGPNNTLVTPVELKSELDNAGIIPGTFVSDPVDVSLNCRNGVVTFLAGTPLNFDLDGDGIPDSIRTVVSYTYQVPNVPGDDSTLGSHRVTVWFQRFIGQTDQYDTTQRYPINQNLFVNSEGKFTSKQPSEFHPGVAIVSGSPSSTFSMLEFIWL